MRIRFRCGAAVVAAMLVVPGGVVAQMADGDLAGMKRLDRLIVSIDLAQAGPIPVGADAPNSIQFESSEVVHIIYGSDPTVVRQRAVVKLLTGQVEWFPISPPLSPARQDPVPVTKWSSDHVLLLETPDGPRELYHSNCGSAQVFLRRDARVVVYGCGRFAVVDLKGNELLQDRFASLSAVPLGFFPGEQRLRLALHDGLPDGRPAPAVRAIVDYDIPSHRRILAAAVNCEDARLCQVMTDGTLLATMHGPHQLEIYSDSLNRLARSDSLVSQARIRFRVSKGLDPVPGATIRFQSALDPDLNLEFRTDAAGRIYVDTVPNSIYCVGTVVQGSVTAGAPYDIHFPYTFNGVALWRPPGASPPPQGGKIQQSFCEAVLARKPLALDGKTRIDGTVVNYAADPAPGRRACLQNIAIPDVRFEFEIGPDGRFSGEVPEGLYWGWLGVPGARPAYSATAAIVGSAVVLRINDHAPETEAKVWGELKNGGVLTVCLRSRDVQKCMDTTRLGQYGFSVPPGSYEATVSRAQAVVWSGRLDFAEPGEYRDPIHLP